MRTTNAEVILTDADLRAIISLVYEKSGISLHEGKRELVAARLQERLRQLGLPSYWEYLMCLSRDDSGEELTLLLDAITTNHTRFFREPKHFDYLKNSLVPLLMDKARRTGLEGWCAASSSGEEPVTIAITLLEAGVDRFRLLASDLSTKVLEMARRGTYKRERVQDVPQALLCKYFEQGLGEQSEFALVAPAVRDHIEYRALNLISIDQLDRKFDFIFCRNVMIYFDKTVQQQVVSMLERHLAPNGHLFISHTESLNGVTHRLKWVAPSIYRRDDLEPERKNERSQVGRSIRPRAERPVTTAPRSAAVIIEAASDGASGQNRRTVGIGEMAVSKDPAHKIVTHALGSSIAVCLWDPAARVGGLLHFLLPDSAINAERAQSQPAVFANTGIPLLFESACSLGLNKSSCRVRLIGGAQVGGLSSVGALNVGKRNLLAAHNILWRDGLLIEAEETGGTVARTVELHVDDGTIDVKSGIDTIRAM